MIGKICIGFLRQTPQAFTFTMFILGALVSGLSARAEDGCPTMADLGTGVLLTRSEPFFSILMRQQGGEITEQRLMERGGAVEQVSATYAHPLAAKLRRAKSGETELRYGDDTSILGDIARKKTVDMPVRFWSGGTQVDEGVAEWRFVRRDNIDIGNCRYEVLVIDGSVSLAKSGTVFSEQAFAPSLGLVVANIRLDVSGKPVSGVFFDNIERAKN